MANERKTENIVRRHFQKFSHIIIEEQQSENIKIQKLLKNASKSGDKQGSPEFIISFKDHPGLIIVIECKASVSKHQSKTKDKYSDYAVDGVLLYASFLAKEFDVIAIAVSGETSKELRISHFLHLKNEVKASPIFSDKLLDTSSYIDGYIQSPEKRRQDYDSLLTFSKELNDSLHSYKVKESQRSLLISGVLIALDNKAFRNSYKHHTTSEDLAKFLADTIINELRNANITSKKLDNLTIAYGFIKTHTSLSTEDSVLVKLIEDIDNNINNFIKTHKYIDVLGQFYIEFLRYANSDKGLGIVLTPPHITELFADIAELNKKSIVYDNCTGTGGFLISAMRKMIEDAANDKNAIKSIKEKQLIGVEWQDDIFALACSNMYIHQDGKTNIIHGSCFDKKIMSVVKAAKPTAGFLNPPYPKKPTDPLELEFVLNNLEVLQPNAICISIIPIGCLCSVKGRDFELKRKILENHTLEAVLSMPNELFHNSKVGVVTAIMVLRAHHPHPKNKETYFGFWKEDGFVKKKLKGRIDVNDRWTDIKTSWLKSFGNKREQKGFCLNRHVEADQEWCIEAYMETDYTTLTHSDFMRVVKNYVLFNLNES